MLSSPFALIGTAWNFYKKQPVLNEIAFWLFFVPVALVDALSGVLGIAHTQSLEDFSMEATTVVLAVPMLCFVLYFTFWGQACVLTVAKRLVSSPAGRNRTSFKAVRTQAKKYIGPLFLTELLRGIFTVFWSFLLIVPGIIYSARTVFFDIMMVENGKVAYGRPVLNKSKEFVKDRTWSVIWRMLVIICCLFLPVGIIDGVIGALLTTLDSRLETLALVLQDFINAFMSVFFIVTVVALYADLKKAS